MRLVLVLTRAFKRANRVTEQSPYGTLHRDCSGFVQRTASAAIGRNEQCLHSGSTDRMPPIGQRNSSGSSRPRSTSSSTDKNDSAGQDDLLDSSIDVKHPLPFRRRVRKPAGTGAKKFYGSARPIANVMIAIAVRVLRGWRVRRRANLRGCLQRVVSDLIVTQPEIYLRYALRSMHPIPAKLLAQDVSATSAMVHD